MEACLVPQHIEMLRGLRCTQFMLEWHMIRMNHLHKAIADRAGSDLDTTTFAREFGLDKEQRAPVACCQNSVERRVQTNAAAASTRALLGCGT